MMSNYFGDYVMWAAALNQHNPPLSVGALLKGVHSAARMRFIPVLTDPLRG